jgi:murein DD-endopeptidase MepM/ murein hydrolase activator NlpD
MPAGPVNTSAVVSQDLPDLGSPSSLGSSKTMPALPDVSPVEVASNPNIEPVASTKPKLSIVPQSSYTHIIESGESLYTIARKYGTTTDAIVRANGLPSADRIYVGQKLLIPGASGEKQVLKTDDTKVASIAPIENTAPRQVLPVKQAPMTNNLTADAPGAAGTSPVSDDSADKFRWPLSGKVIADFAASKGTGINIEAPEGSAVRAAQTGSVIYVGSAVEGYGNLILVKHDNGFVSAYAHLSQITVAKGDTVVRGDAIGLTGKTGSVSTPQLHFELRKGATPVDPMPMLAS